MNERQFSNTVDATKETLICHPSKQVNIKKRKVQQQQQQQQHTQIYKK